MDADGPLEGSPFTATSDMEDGLTQSPASNSKKARRTPETSPNSPVKLTNYDPHTLLSPSSQRVRARDDPEHKQIQQDTTAEQDDSAEGFSSSVNLLEKLHGVTKREAAPLKRQKGVPDAGNDEDSPRKKAKFFGAAKGGIIGDSVREERQKALEQEGPGPNEQISLMSTTDDDDELEFVGSRPLQKGYDPKQEICLGTLDANIGAYKVPNATNKALGQFKEIWPPSKVRLRRKPGLQNWIEVVDRAEVAFGTLEFRVAEPLGILLNGQAVHKLRTTTFLKSRPRVAGQNPGDEISESLPCRITLFCAREFSQRIGTHLSHRSLWLSDPGMANEGKEIVNPHKPKNYAPKPANHAALLGTGTGSVGSSTNFTARSAEEIASDVKGVIDNLPNSQGLPFEDSNTSLVKTPLMDHQKQALWWQKRRETPYDPNDKKEVGLWKRDFTQHGRNAWYNTISGHTVKELPECLGGLFSDDMGLGKTLSILARVAATHAESAVFGGEDLSKKMAQHETVERNAKSTLIICPTGVLSNWDEQIKQHLNMEEISYYKYHGSKRIQDLDELAKHDIVLTTYGTASGEFIHQNGKYTALTKLNWFRIVLDEAHSIKNMQTGWFKGACSIESPRRWAVTGTPIQNRLDDLGALIKFIRLTPFQEKGAWEQYFLATFKSGNDLALPNLKALVGSIMLRRSKRTIDIEDPDRRVVELEFSAEERALYDIFLKDSTSKADIMFSKDGRLRGRAIAHMLTFITRLRLICCHGRELMSEEDMKVLNGRTIQDPIDLGDEDEDKPPLTEYQIYHMLWMMRESSINFCLHCGVEVGQVQEDKPAADEDESDEETNGAKDVDSNDDVLGYMTPCFHVLCPKHIGAYQAQADQSLTSDNFCTCPSCTSYIRYSFPPITREGIRAEEARRAELRSNPQKAREKSKYTGKHTKVKALIECLRANELETAALPPGSPPIRSVVFSGWTQYLDLIGLALTDENIPHLRLDGTMHATKRAKVIEQFRTEDRYAVLLVSIRAGGQGLNFTAANKVYMMEPQFNPGVENQAVDRVHRLGQKRRVEIVKFIMRDSFEGKIVALQEKKLMLAREAFGEGKGGVKERMEGLRSLFR